MNPSRRHTAAWLLLGGLPVPALAQTVSLRLASLVPKNSLYHQQLLELGESWRAAQGGGARFVVFTDGSQGGEAELARRMRIGQLGGALLSVVGLREIEPSISALQNLPLLFRSWEEVDFVRDRMRPAMEQKFLAKGFVVLGWGDAGWVRFFSRSPAFRPDDYKGMKFFAWGSEPEQQTIMKSLGYTPVPLENRRHPAFDPDRHDRCRTLDAVFALASRSSTPQNTCSRSTGRRSSALVVTRKAWDAMSPAGQAALRSAGDKAGLSMRMKARAEVDEAVEAMKKRGLVVNRPSPEQLREWDRLAEQLYPRIRGTMVPAETFDEVFRHLAAFRSGKGK